MTQIRAPIYELANLLLILVLIKYKLHTHT